MDHVCSSTKDIHNSLLIDPNMETIHQMQSTLEQFEEQEPLFLSFPSPFFDDISTIYNQNKPLNVTEEPLRSGSKHLKKTSGGKKDRHSKIHTAQGLRDRRMRLSLHIARKFFYLQDLLGFDKASKTIEWLFCKSNKAIKEVTENFDPQHIDQSIKELVNLEVGLAQEIKITSAKKLKNSKEEEVIKKRESRKQIQSSSLVKETRDQARARARDRTRKRLLIKEQLERSKQLLEGNPKDEVYKVEELLGFISSPSQPQKQESSSSSFEHSGTHHLVPQPLLATNNGNCLENFSRSVVDTSPLSDHNLQEGWMNSWNGFFAGEWDIADSFVTEYCNYGSVLTGDTNYEQNPSSFFMSTTTNVLHFQSPNQGK